MSDFVHTNAFLELALIFIGFGAGVFGAILGLGGGVIVVPALTLLFGVSIRYAVAASLVSVIATSSGAAATYVRDHITNIRVAMLLEVATTLGALSGAMLTTKIDANYLYGLFALIMVYSAATMARKRKNEILAPSASSSLAKRLRLMSTYPDAVQKQEIAYGVTGVGLAFTLMLGAGLISALIGIGSGALKVPAMDAAMHLPIKVSTATSNFMIGVTGAASAGAYYTRGEILPFLAAPVALGVLGGSWAGARIMVRLSNVWLRRLFIVFLLIIAVQMAAKTIGVNLR